MARTHGMCVLFPRMAWRCQYRCIGPRIAGKVIPDEKTMADTNTMANRYVFGDVGSRNLYRAAVTVCRMCRLSGLVRMESKIASWLAAKPPLTDRWVLVRPNLP